MARSLHVKHEEAPATSPLLTGFLLIAVAWLALSALVGFSADAATAPSPGGAPVVDAVVVK